MYTYMYVHVHDMYVCVHDMYVRVHDMYGCVHACNSHTNKIESSMTDCITHHKHYSN